MLSNISYVPEGKCDHFVGSMVLFNVYATLGPLRIFPACSVYSANSYSPHGVHLVACWSSFRMDPSLQGVHRSSKRVHLSSIPLFILLILAVMDGGAEIVFLKSSSVPPKYVPAGHGA